MSQISSIRVKQPPLVRNNFHDINYKFWRPQVAIQYPRGWFLSCLLSAHMWLTVSGIFWFVFMIKKNQCGANLWTNSSLWSSWMGPRSILLHLNTGISLLGAGFGLATKIQAPQLIQNELTPGGKVGIIFFKDKDFGSMHTYFHIKYWYKISRNKGTNI